MTPAQVGSLDQTIAVDSAEPIEKAIAGGPLTLHRSAFQSERNPTHLQVVQEPWKAVGGSPTLLLWTRPEKRATSILELCDEAKLTTYAHPNGARTHHIQFRLWHWHDRECEIRLPAGYRILTAKLHDRWLPSLDVKDEPNGVRLRLPFDQNAELVHYEIFASSQSEGGWLPGLTAVDVPAIEWPIAPVDLRTQVCLAGNLTPLGSTSFVPVGVPARIAELPPMARGLRHLWNWGAAWWPYGAHAELLEQLENQKQTVLAAEAELHSAKAMKWSEALERFAFEHLKGRVPLVIDRAAAHAHGVGPDTLLPAAALSPQAARPFWEAAGLIYVAGSRCALLTSVDRLKSLGIHDPSQVVELDDALREAVLQGRDASAGFYSIVAWLKLPRRRVWRRRRARPLSRLPITSATSRT